MCVPTDLMSLQRSEVQVVESLAEMLIFLQLCFLLTGEKISLNTFYSDIKIEVSCYFSLLSKLHALSTGALVCVRSVCACGIPVVG